eukprot:gnl/Ergobibamus_cyprinoides/1927.p4 GENE.gnl/Ergobibamus_cyprinoides/1927~~gnl/Ergobibamus_cyprinoides/1927.p4  ORF type:complete len:102 (-),score=2.04 gnl/Ergobibamus_cyprinoides/1927:405-710(-)
MADAETDGGECAGDVAGPVTLSEAGAVKYEQLLDSLEQKPSKEDLLGETGEEKVTGSEREESGSGCPVEAEEAHGEARAGNKKNDEYYGRKGADGAAPLLG